MSAAAFAPAAMVAAPGGGDGEAALKEAKVLIKEFPKKFKKGVSKGIYDFFIYSFLFYLYFSHFLTIK